MKLTLPGRRAGASGHGARTRAAATTTTTTTQKQRAPAAPWPLVGVGGRASLFLMGGLGRASLFLWAASAACGGLVSYPRGGARALYVFLKV
jgi:hypothetical protein